MTRQELIEQRGLATTALRDELNNWETKNRASANDYDRVAVGLSKDKVERIEADLDRIDSQIRSFDKDAAFKKSEAEPEFNTRRAGASAPSTSGEDFYNALRSGDASYFKRVMSVGPAGAAPTSAVVPNEISLIIREKLNTMSVMRNISTVYSTDGALKIPIEDALPTTYFLAESAAVTTSDATFGTSVQVTPYRFSTKTTLTNEFLADAQAGGGLDYVARKVGESMALKQNSYFMNGTNSTQPQGIFTATQAALNSASQVASDLGTAAVTTVDGDDIIDLYFKLASPYRNSASYMTSDLALKAIRKLKDSSSQYIWRLSDDTGGLNLGLNGTLMGRPVYTDPDIVTTTTNGNVAIVFGDFKGYEIFDRPMLEMLIDPYSSAGTGETILYTTSRMDAKIPQLSKFVFTTI
jgi:HK97 family phage major capsid protein